MARPALSASRGIDIIDAMIAAGGRGQTLSELALATGINLASCHAVTSVLVARGYLASLGARRGFTLGPVLAAAGEAALLAQPLLALIGSEATALNEALDLPVTATALVGESIVAVLATGGTAKPLLRLGERRPFIPPVGAPFIAWAGEADIADWLARLPELSADDTQRLRAAAAAIRARGFEVLLRNVPADPVASQLARLAAGDHARHEAGHQLGPNMALPGEIEPDRQYDVTMIAAPVFDRAGRCAYNLCLGPFGSPLTGAEIAALADRLLQGCLAVMHRDRAQAGGADSSPRPTRRN